MGIITAALVTGGVMPVYKVPDWVIICCALAMAGGTMAGGWRVVKTMGQRITKLNPFGGFAAETSAAITLIGTAAAESGQLDAGDYRRDYGRRSFATDHCGSLGRDAAYPVGVDSYDSRRGFGGRNILFGVLTLDAMR